MADGRVALHGTGATKEEATAKAEALAREHFGDKPLPERLDTRVLVGGQIDEAQQLVAGAEATWTVQLVYPVTDRPQGS
jgi:hypothetical protein